MAGRARPVDREAWRRCGADIGLQAATKSPGSRGPQAGSVERNAGPRQAKEYSPESSNPFHHTERRWLTLPRSHAAGAALVAGARTETSPPSLRKGVVMQQQISDRFGRRFHYLRLSVTEVCNFRCQYCLPNGSRCSPRGFLSVAEIGNLLAAFAELGVWKVRLTGGEPMVRRDFLQIVEAARAIPGIRRLALTTNGYRLAASAVALKAAGLDAVNISLDSLDPEGFRRITGDRRFERVVGSIDACVAAGIDRVKVNTVLLAGLNAEALDDFFAFVHDRPISLRFIELMRTADNPDYFARHHVSGSVVRERLLAGGWQAVPRSPVGGPAVEYAHADHRGRIGLIAPYAEGFCEGCNRLRVGARGGLRLCLFGRGSHDLRRWLQSAHDREGLKQQILSALAGKPRAHALHRADSGDMQQLATIGG
jgi:GTP 3',8-cyclase